MDVKVGTFNLNNLFSRYNFSGEIQAIKAGDTGVEASYDFTDPTTYKIRTFKGRLVKGKDPKDTATIAARILSMGVDVLGLQEVEDLDTLKRFAIDNLGSAYPFVVLVEGNDPRLIDVGVLSKLPIGRVTSWQKAVHPSDPTQPVFSRDLLEVEIMSSTRSKRLFTLFVNHLKSHFVPFDQDPLLGALMTLRAETRAAIFEHVEAEDFFDPTHRAIFEAEFRLHHRGEPVDAITVGVELEGTRKLERLAGGRLYLADLVVNTAVPAAAVYHAARVGELARRRRIMESAGGVVRAALNGSTAAELDRLALDLTELVASGTERMAGSTWQVVDLEPAIEGVREPGPAMGQRIDGACLFYLFKVNELHGEPETLKLLIAQHCAVEVIRQGGTVLYIDLEDALGSVVERVLALGATEAEVRERSDYIRPDEPLTAAALDALWRRVEARRYDLAVIDGMTELYDLHSLNPNESVDAAKIRRLLSKPLAARGMAVVEVDHVIKDKERRGRFAAGSLHKLAGVDGGLLLSGSHPAPRSRGQWPRATDGGEGPARPR